MTGTPADSARQQRHAAGRGGGARSRWLKPEFTPGASAISLLQSPQPPPIEAVLATLLNELGLPSLGLGGCLFSIMDTSGCSSAYPTATRIGVSALGSRY